MGVHRHREAMQLHVDVASAIQRGAADVAQESMLRIMQQTMSEMSSIWESQPTS
jgi:DNA-binding FadR family transcriptional regulator